jgi:acyl-CoA synthetase (AMP-forming)/AMP-acid ligase II
MSNDALSKHEVLGAEHIPYVRHVDSYTVALTNGELPQAAERVKDRVGWHRTFDLGRVVSPRPIPCQHGAVMSPPIHWKSEFLPLAQRYGQRMAIVDLEGAVTYSEVLGRAAGIAKAVLDLGVVPCAPVATYLTNSRAAVWASYGVTLAGVAEVRLNAALAGDDIAHCIRTAGIKAVVTSRDKAAAFAPFGIDVLCVEDIGMANLATLDCPHVSAGGWSRIGFTSGTTGKPKGIVHSQEGRWTANMLLRASLSMATGPGNTVLLMTPFSHGAALMTYAFLDGGACVTLVPGVEEKVVLPLLEQDKVDQIFAPPTVLAKILSFSGGRTFPGIRAIYTGTAPLTGSLYRAARKTFGPVVRVTYGMSELWNPITVLSPEETDAFYGGEGEPESACVGWPGSGVEIEIAPADEDPGTEEEAGTAAPAAGDLGRVKLRARHLYVGNLRDGEFTPRDSSQPYDTADLGFLDERGRLHLCGRAADVMKSGGYKIAPEEIEAALRKAAAPAEIVVFSLPSDYWGEIVTIAFCGGRAPDTGTLEKAVAAMTGYKRPRLQVTLPEVPRNSIGKIQRRLARAAVLERYTLEDGPRPRLVEK